MRRARATLAFERLYAATWGAVCVAALLLTALLLGAHEAVPGWAHAGMLAAFAAAGVVLLSRGLRGQAPPTRDEALARIEADSRVRPGSFRALDDRPFAGDPDDPLWTAHAARLARRAERARLKGARARVDEADPLGLRFAALVLLAAALLFAGDRAGGRLSAGLRPDLAFGGPVTADLWLDPPAYTGRAPVLLVRSGPLPEGTQAEVAVPEGSVLRLRLTGEGRRAPRARVSVVTRAAERRIDLVRGEGASTAEAALDRNAALLVRSGGRRAVWPLAVVPDRPPSVRFTDALDDDGGTELVLPLATTDDYGIASAVLVLRLRPDQPLPADLGGPEPSVLAAPDLVPLPQAAGVPGEREARIDLAEHPWAGLDVDLAVRVTDGKGQTDETPALPVRLRAPRFYDPLARTVIEQRRHLAAAPSSWTRTARLLDALTLAPERFAEGSREYLLLRTAYHDVMADRGADTPAVAETFLPLARALEDEGLQLARARLDEAADALRRALADGAPDAEIERLIEALRTAMNDYVAALAASGDAMGEADRELEGADLDDMLDAMRDMAERGLRSEAEGLLSQLERMLDNLSITPGEGQAGGEGQGSGQGGGQGQGSGQGQAGGGPLGEAGDIVEEQRRLTDETFGARRGDRGTGGLAAAQRDLARRLDGLGAGDGDEAGDAFGQARRAMEGAARALERGELGAAQALQESAIEGLTEGARALAEAQRDGRGEGQAGEGQASDGQAGEGQSGAGRDPLGRPYGQPGESGVEIPDLADPERLRAVIEALRRRLADPDLDEDERAYLERLLERF